MRKIIFPLAFLAISSSAALAEEIYCHPDNPELPIIVTDDGFTEVTPDVSWECVWHDEGQAKGWAENRSAEGAVICTSSKDKKRTHSEFRSMEVSNGPPFGDALLVSTPFVDFTDIPACP